MYNLRSYNKHKKPRLYKRHSPLHKNLMEKDVPANMLSMAAVVYLKYWPQLTPAGILIMAQETAVLQLFQQNPNEL